MAFIANTVVFVVIDISGDDTDNMAIIGPDHAVLWDGEEEGIVDVEHLESE